MNRRIITTKDAPAAIGPYSQAIKTGNLLFVSGQIPFEAETGTLVEGGIKEQTRQVLKNLDGILASEGLTAQNAVKVTIFLKDMNDFGVVNEIYAEMFSENPPARECVEVARLPKDVLVEISLIATY